MKKILLILVLVIVVAGVIVWLISFSKMIIDEAELDLNTPAKIEEAVETVNNEIDQIELEETEFDTILDELESLPF